MHRRARPFMLAFVAGVLAVLGNSACLDRKVSTGAPSTKVILPVPLAGTKVDKVDLLFMIDNSASMADKQEILSEAVPDLITSLVNPSCIDESGRPTGEKANPGAPVGLECARGTPEFAPVTDIHIGIISSSMGGFGGGGCKDPARPHERDGARLLRRTPNGGELSGMGASSYLAWLPDVPANASKPRPYGANPYTDLDALKRDAASLVRGVGDQGCGFEAQLESVYHFLVAPDPYESIEIENNRARLVGLDSTLLEQRANFLRPDSLVAVVMLTDEDDSQVDPMAFGGGGHYFANEFFPDSSVKRGAIGAQRPEGTTASRGTAACKAAPFSAECTSCFRNTARECAENGGFMAADSDYMNVRFHKMRSRFGLDPQYPISRYLDGFSKATLTDRAGDAEPDPKKRRSCTNPLFAAELPRGVTDPADPRLCNLPRGRRQPSQIFFAVIGGVPQDLLHFTPGDPKASELVDSDWDKIIGKDEDHYQRDDGVDPRMVQSMKPRAGRPGPSSTAGDNTEGNEVRDYETKNYDLQYACTFPLRNAKACKSPESGCDCNGHVGLNPPLCAPGGKEQIFAKAYPTPRELRVARGLGKQGIASSLCPISLDPVRKDGSSNPLYGYRPAVNAVVERLKNGLLTTCLPQPLARDSSGSVPCVVLHTLPERGARCQDTPGYSAPDAVVLESFLRTKKQVDTSYEGKTVCRATQLPVPPGASCLTSTEPGFCYVENTEAARPLRSCSQALVFSRTGTPASGVMTDLLCIQQIRNDAEP